ncbi:MAG: hypothetical protein H8D34_24120, partial [Chloroflexi bacterium]|nr:hypothetical protein [Chloroflexota bacterium]
MPKKTRTMLRFFLGSALSGTITTLLLVAHLSKPWGTILQELGRGMVAMTFGGVAASLGLLVSEEILLYNGHLSPTLLRLILLVFPHMALGLLWQR